MADVPLLSDHLAEALAALSRARDAARSAVFPVANRDLDAAVVVQREITQAELSIARVIGLIAGTPS